MTVSAVTGTARPWLPEAAIDAGLDRAIAAAARDWSAHWLPAGALKPLARNLVADDAAATWLAVGDGLALGVPTAARDVLALALLAAPAGATLVGAADRRHADAALNASLRDLGERLAAAAGLSRAAIAPATRRPALNDAHQRLLGLDHQPLVTCLVAHDAAIAAARPRGVATRGGLASFSAALAPQPVTLAARVGGCTLSLAELAALEPGDVVLLNRPVGDAADLTLDATLRPLARAAVQPGDAALSLKLLDAIDR